MSYDKNKYAEMYRHPEWQKMRLKIMGRDEFKCLNCGDSEKTLNVHHSYYVKDRKPWQYPDFSLVTLCEDCHKERHDIPPDEIRPNGCWMEWECELEWIFGGDNQLQEYFWDTAASICKAMSKLASDGLSPRDSMDAIRKHLDAIIAEQPSKPKRRKGKSE